MFIERDVLHIYLFKKIKFNKEIGNVGDIIDARFNSQAGKLTC